MTWLEQTIIRILLLIVRLLAQANRSPELAKEIKDLATHISVHAPARGDR